MTRNSVLSKSIAAMTTTILVVSGFMFLFLFGAASVVLADWTFEEKIEVASSQIAASSGTSGSSAHSLAIKSDQTTVAWGDNSLGQCAVPIPNEDFIAVSAGSTHSLGLKSDGSVVAWGDNSYGQCNVPTPNTDFVAISAGMWHNLALKSDGSIVAWGDNSFGQCAVPAPNEDFIAVAAGGLQSIGLKSDGTLVLWGTDIGLVYAGVPFGTVDPPVPNENFTAISANTWHNLALKSDGTVVVWGIDISTMGPWSPPSTNADFVAISAGLAHNLALKSDGSIISWGADPGDPGTVPTGTGFVGIAAGANHSLALHNDNTITAWGNNDYNQLDVPAPNSDWGYYPEEEPSLGPGEMAIWLEVESTLITHLEQCETFGLIATGMHSQLTFPNVDDEDPYATPPDVWPEYEPGAYGQPLDAQDYISLSQQGPGTNRQDNSLLKTEKVDYNVAGNVTFNTDVYPIDDFRNVVDPNLTVPITRLSIERRTEYGISGITDNGGVWDWSLYGGTEFENRIRVIAAQNPSVTENGLDFGLDLDIDLPDNTPPGLYKTTLVFMTYQT